MLSVYLLTTQEFKSMSILKCLCSEFILRRIKKFHYANTNQVDHFCIHVYNKQSDGMVFILYAISHQCAITQLYFIVLVNKKHTNFK